MPKPKIGLDKRTLLILGCELCGEKGICPNRNIGCRHGRRVTITCESLTNSADKVVYSMPLE